MRLGIYGGSFDPVHFGHLLLAESCREQCRLDEVWFVPAAVPPHKRQREMTLARQRIEMLELAVGGTDAFRVCPIEIDRGGVSYTVDTLSQIQQDRPGDSLFLLMGADSLHDFATWREPRRICELALPLVVHRAGSPPALLEAFEPLVAPERFREIQAHQVEMPLIDLSSSEIRRRIAEGRGIRFRTPRAIEQYIATHQLYLAAPNDDHPK